jgi:hypothetical protein
MGKDKKLMKFIESNQHLSQLNKRRTRNIILYQSAHMNVIYDLKRGLLQFESKVPFSNIEHDTNRVYTEQICKELMLNYKTKKKVFINMLRSPRTKKYKSSYKKYIAILEGKTEFNDEDILVLISILGRLNQERQMGPISVMKDEKLNPKRIAEHTTLKQYIIACINTIKEYSNFYLENRNELKLLNNVGFNGLLDKKIITANPIPLLTYNTVDVAVALKTVPTIKGNALSPNYIASFFNQLVELSEFKDLPIILDDYKDIIDDLIEFSQRFRGNGIKEISSLIQVKTILLTQDFEYIMSLVRSKIYGKTKTNTYYKIVSKFLLNLDSKTDQKMGFYTLIHKYEEYINEELSNFMEFKEENSNLDYNNCEISIASDMHFNKIDKICKSNYSKNFNIVAGDFYNNSYHRGGFPITDALNIPGIGVLGNHDVNWLNRIQDIKYEVNSKYKKSIEILNKSFPNIKILNNEVFYKNGIAFVGLTIVTDEDNVGNRSFFAKKDLGNFFVREDYIKNSRLLLNSINPNIPVVVISHSPFKEYSVSRNKHIGVYSNKIFSDYPNVKMYIHGHGHSVPQTKIIDDIICVSNPIVNNIYSDSLMSYNWVDLSNTNELDSKMIIVNSKQI